MQIQIQSRSFSPEPVVKPPAWDWAARPERGSATRSNVASQRVDRTWRWPLEFAPCCGSQSRAPPAWIRFAVIRPFELWTVQKNFVSHPPRPAAVDSALFAGHPG